MSAKQQLISTAIYIGHECHNCRLRLKSDSGLEECSMEATRDRWTNPLALFYCDDPYAKKYVKVFNIKQSKVKRITS